MRQYDERLSRVFGGSTVTFNSVTNTHVVGEVHIIPEAISRLYAELLRVKKELESEPAP